MENNKNLAIWNNLKSPPKEALTEIKGGRLSGFTDISPMWRYKAMTEQFGMCGVGWKYEVVRVFSEPGSDEQVFAFAEIKLYIRAADSTSNAHGWSEPIPGIGGSMLIAKEKAGPHSSDEAYKMAITDALSVAMKMIGVGADVYMGMMDGKHTPPAGKPADDPDVDHTKRTKLWKIMLKMNYDIIDDARKELKILSGFTTKDKKFVEGKETVADLKGKRLLIVLKDAEKEYEDWKKKEAGEEQPPEDDEPTQSTMSDKEIPF